MHSARRAPALVQWQRAVPACSALWGSETRRERERERGAWAGPGRGPRSGRDDAGAAQRGGGPGSRPKDRGWAGRRGATRRAEGKGEGRGCGAAARGVAGSIPVRGHPPVTRWRRTHNERAALAPARLGGGPLVRRRLLGACGGGAAAAALCCDTATSLTLEGNQGLVNAGGPAQGCPKCRSHMSEYAQVGQIAGNCAGVGRGREREAWSASATTPAPSAGERCSLVARRALRLAAGPWVRGARSGHRGLRRLSVFF